MEKSCISVLIKNIITFIISSVILSIVIYLTNKVNNGGLSLVVATAPILILQLITIIMSVKNLFGFIYTIKSEKIITKIIGIIMLIATIGFVIYLTIYIFKFLNILGVF